jgi:hypothetical protein
MRVLAGVLCCGNNNAYDMAVVARAWEYLKGHAWIVGEKGRKGQSRDGAFGEVVCLFANR